MSRLPVKIDENAELPAMPDISNAQIELYLAYLETSGRKRYSAIMAGVDPGRMVYLMNKDDDLKALEMSAMQGYCELIDAAVHDRAINGTPKGVYFKGQRIATERVYSDTLLLALAKAHNPKYRDHLSVDANVKAGVLVVQTSLNPDEWEKEYGGMRVDQKRIDDLCTESDKEKQ
jgi:hypothetical protein